MANSQKSWRDAWKPIIAKVINENHGKSRAELAAVLREAFPAGPREHYPYRIWLDEIRVQLGEKQLKRQGRKLAVPAPGQQELFR